MENTTNKPLSARLSEAIGSLFDEGTFVELGGCVRRASGDGEVPVGVVTGYGAVGGELVYLFAFDRECASGAVESAGARKIASLYDLAMKNASPVVGLFASAGASITDGAEALAAYGKIASCVAKASGRVAQIAWIDGLCTGTLAGIAAMFDLSVLSGDGCVYVAPRLHTDADRTASDVISLRVKETSAGARDVRAILSYLPENARASLPVADCGDDPSRAPKDATIEEIADAGSVLLLGSDYAPEGRTALCRIGGVPCGIVEAGDAPVGAAVARKFARFVGVCDAYGLPLVTLASGDGLSFDGDGDGIVFASEIARLASAYANAACPLVTLVKGACIGGAFTLLGSKSIGADVAYALDTSVISALRPDAAVAFCQNERVTGSDSRRALEDEWRETMASPALAGAAGEVDGIIPLAEARARIVSALYMLPGIGDVSRRHPTSSL